ncbi:MAG: molybdopterin-binding protein [Oscillospiraceae bacterium]|nr:molybdopterin-binding protein [Oscillospiraceae bacterium]
MKLIRTEDAVGQVLCHDMTQIIPGQYKGPRFRKGHVVTAEDVPVLLRMGKENLYVFELGAGMLHENDAAERMCALCLNEGMTRGAVGEGKIELFAAHDGLFCVDRARLNAVNDIDELMIATRHGNTPVRAGDKLAGTRVIPLVIAEEKLAAAERIVDGRPLLSLLPYRLRRAGVVTTGSEVFRGRIEDAFTPVVERKLAQYGIAVTAHETVDDGLDNIRAAIERLRATDVELILCTGGMSVDPDDNTPGAIRASGARIVTYGAPVLPGAMFLLGYYDDGRPVMGLPGCVMYARSTIFDLVLPRVAAGVTLTRRDFTTLGEGGLCLGCPSCSYPNCGFGKGKG